MAYYWDAPLCLIQNTDEHGLVVDDTTFEELCKIKQPVSVVAIAGLYRTGKSFLMNKLADSHSGFDLGSTVQSKTKGIWAWCRPHPTRKDECLLLLDTEGLGDVEKGDKNHDTWIFALAVLLSSTLVYNSIGTIDQVALDNLQFVTKISENVKIKAKASEDGTELGACFPNFVWAIRDFTLELKLDGKDITSDEYLEHALQLKAGLTPTISQANTQKMMFKAFFPKRKCFTFPQPVKETEMFGRLETLNESELDPKFVSVSAEFVKHVYEQVQPKMVDGRKVNGSVLAHLAKCYVEAIQKGAVPCIQSAVETTAQLENARAVQESVDLYSILMQERIQLPTENLKQLSDIHHECEVAAIKSFMNLSIFDDEQSFQKQMIKDITGQYEKYCRQNEEESVKRCFQILGSLYGPIGSRVQAADYTKPGGYLLYATDMEQMERDYNDTNGKGVKAKEAFTEFMAQKEPERKSILVADKKLDEEQKKIEDEKRKVAESKRQQEAAEEEKRIAEQRLEDQRKSHAENMKQMQEKMAAEKEAFETERRIQYEKAKQEHDELLKKGLTEQASLLSLHLQKVKENMETESTANKVIGVIGKVIDAAAPLIKLYTTIKKVDH